MDRARAALRPLAIDDSREPRHVGRRARLELVFERRGNRTVLARSFAEPPLRVGRSFDEGDGVHLILTTSAPGIFGGDRFEQTIHVGPGARVRLTSQSAMQVHASPEREAAHIRTRYVVSEEGQLRCRWHPLIPFSGSRLDQRIDIQLASGAKLSWSDAFMAGRIARGEQWMFDELSHELRIERLDVLEYMERYRLAPVEDDPTHPWMAGAASSFGTTLSSGLAVDRESAERLHRELASISKLRASADVLGERFVLVRLMGDASIPFHDGRAMAESVCSS